MKKNKLNVLALSSFLFLIVGLPKALAHCPLCTVGAAALGGGALWLGISNSVIGLFIGAFAVALGLWLNKLIKRRIKFQTHIILVGTFLLTVVPLIPIFQNYVGLPVFMIGEYGSLLNRVYLIETFFIGSLIGAFLVLISPRISEKLTTIRNGNKIAFQGMIVTFLSLVTISILLQIIGI